MEKTTDSEGTNNTAIVGNITRNAQTIERVKNRLISAHNKVTPKGTLPFIVPERAYAISGERVPKQWRPPVVIKRQVAQFSESIDTK